MKPLELLESRTFDEISIGESANLKSKLLKSDITFFTWGARGAKEKQSHGATLQEAWIAAQVSTLLATKLPGPGTICLSQKLTPEKAIEINDTIRVTLSVSEKRPEDRTILFACDCSNQFGDKVMTGTVTAVAAANKIKLHRPPPSEALFQEHGRYEELIACCHGIGPIRTAVVYPCDEVSLEGALEAAKAGLILPVLVGPGAKIRSAAASSNMDITGVEIVEAEDSPRAAKTAVALAREGKVDALMKGSLHTDELMHEVTAAETGLRTERRISHAFVMDVPAYPEAFIITDAAINIFPKLEDKRDICQNAIDLAQALGFEEPRVAVLSAVETVTTKIPSTLDAAALCKMADRGQITGGIIDGPLAFDNAVSVLAAKEKHIVSPVAGRANILLVPDLEAGNMLAKQLTYLANADSAGIVLGTRVPVILTSRADDVRTRLASAAVAVLLCHARHRRAVPAATAVFGG